MKRYYISIVLLMFVTVLLSNTIYAQEKGQVNKWESSIQAFEKQDKEQFPEPGIIEFAGSSSIVMWKTLAEDFKPLKVINRGFGGSQMFEVLQFADRIIIPYKPGIIVLYAGDNDIASGKAPETVLNDFKLLVEKVHKALPETFIYYISIKPSILRWAMWQDMKKANELIQSFTKQNKFTEFIDIGSPMFDKEGKPRADLFLSDNLHINTEGYKIWTSVIKPRLVQRTEKKK